MEIRDIYIIVTIIFAAGVLYGNLKSFRKDFDAHRIESANRNKQFELTMFGVDGRNGVVGDVHTLKEHVKNCPFGHGKREHEQREH